MINSTDVRIFSKAAETLNFQEAGNQLQTSRSAVSRRIANLEKKLGTVLINRTPRSISLTEAGRILWEHCREIEDAFRRAEEAVQDRDQEPTGTLRFSVPTSLGAALLPTLTKDFLSRYPLLRLAAHFSEPYVDIVRGGYDVVIRLARKLPDSSFVAQRLATSPKMLMAWGPSYGIHAVYPQKNPPAKVRAFIDFVKQRLSTSRDDRALLSKLGGRHWPTAIVVLPHSDKNGADVP